MVRCMLKRLLFFPSPLIDSKDVNISFVQVLTSIYILTNILYINQFQLSNDLFTPIFYPLVRLVAVPRLP